MKGYKGLGRSLPGEIKKKEMFAMNYQRSDNKIDFKNMTIWSSLHRLYVNAL